MTSTNRPAAIGSNGMVASAHPVASVAGLRMLMEGGNAFDAALATATTLGVVEPYWSGVGGIGVALAYVARESKVRALDFSGSAPQGAEPSRFTPETKARGIMSGVVPGNVAGWLTLHEAFGSMERERVFLPAIEYAENGFAATALNSQMIAQDLQSLRGRATPGAVVFSGSTRAPQPGERLKSSQLSGTLRLIAKHGKEVFYTGELAHRMASASKSAAGLLQMDDLAGYSARWQVPIQVPYRQHGVSTTPPNSGGFQILGTLRVMDGYKDLAYHDPRSLHLMVEALKRCRAERAQYGGDPDFVDIPLDILLSDDHAEKLREDIEADVALPPHGRRESPASGSTTHFGVADRDGNVVSITQTLGDAFGSGVLLGDTGIFLNNMCKWFSLDEGSPNLIGPGKRVDFVLAPTLTEEANKVHLSLGTPGGAGILQTTPQVLMHILEYGMDIQEAIEAPRLLCAGDADVTMEDRFPADVVREIERRGYKVKLADGWSLRYGGFQGIQIDHKAGVFHGGADPRRDGVAVGW